jgi:plastocyanin
LRRSALTLALVALLAPGCGGDDAPKRTVTVPANGKVQVVGREYSFDPSGIVVKGAGRLTLTLRNEGSLAHNIKVLRGDEQLGGTPSFPAGRSESATVNLEHGTYEFVCTVGDHAELGMKGELVVE